MAGNKIEETALALGEAIAEELGIYIVDVSYSGGILCYYIDKDGGVTTADARLALRYAIKLQTLTVEQRLAADVDFSRSVAPKDARAILRAAIGLEPIVPEFKTFYRNDIDGVDF